MLKLKFWLFGKLLNSLKSKLVDGSLNILKLVTEKEIFAFARLVSRRKSFVQDIRTVNVKKGKRKYTLLFVTTLDGTTRINLGRHYGIERGYETIEYGIG